MDQSEDPRELERQLELASRIASSITDQSTVEPLRAWIEDLKQKLRQRSEARRTKQEITVRAREIWEQTIGRNLPLTKVIGVEDSGWIDQSCG